MKYLGRIMWVVLTIVAVVSGALLAREINLMWKYRDVPPECSRPLKGEDWKDLTKSVKLRVLGRDLNCFMVFLRANTPNWDRIFFGTPTPPVDGIIEVRFPLAMMTHSYVLYFEFRKGVVINVFDRAKNRS
jgi:hypothetical protein